MEKRYISPCVKCGKMPFIKKILGMYYVQCSCNKFDPYEFCGARESAAWSQWEFMNRPIERCSYSDKNKKNK